MPTKFDFLSPGVQLREIDQSQVPESPQNPGILLIGRARSGPAMKPIQVKNLNDFIEIFGKPIDGVRNDDPWRDGNTGAPNYAAYAAQAYLASGVGPVKYVRLLGKSLNGVTSGVNAPGWSMGSTFGDDELPAGGGAAAGYRARGLQRISSSATAYGLFIVPSASGPATVTSGTLAAIFYSSGSAFALSGTVVSSSAGMGTLSNLSASTLQKGNASSYGVKLGLVPGSKGKPNAISQAAGDAGVTMHTVNFAGPQNSSYIRNVLNTDPTLFYNNLNYNQGVSSSYWLGETFDVNVDRLSGAGEAAKTYYFIAGLGATGKADYDDFHQELTAAKTGWFIGERPDRKYLFRLIALDDGEEFQKNYYCRITNIVLATTLQPNARFTLEIWKRGGTILNDQKTEEYTGLSLDESSPDYISKKIGDINQYWNASEKKFTIEGLYPNISNFVRVQVATDANLSKADVPVGFLGPISPPIMHLSGGNALLPTTNAVRDTGGPSWIHGSSSIAMGNSLSGSQIIGSAFGAKLPNHLRTKFGIGGVGPARVPMIAGWPQWMGNSANQDLTASIHWPRFGMTTVGSKMSGQNYPNTAMFGLRHVKSDSLLNDPSFNDIARRRSSIDPDFAEGASFASASFVFSLEDIRSSSVGATDYYWESGSYGKTGDAGVSIVKDKSLSHLIKTTKIKQFAAPFFGGANGVDVRWADPFSTYQLGAGNAGGTSGYPYYTYEQAIEMVRDPENLRYELISSPGLVKANLVDKIVDVATERGDALAVIDLEGIFRAATDTGNGDDEASQTKLINTLNTQVIDSSYACTYFPNVRMKDTLNGNGTILKAPPSVAGIGAMAQSDVASSPWFAPAGFNRGGLARLGGTAGPVVVGTVLHLNKDNRDELYEAQVNPIARFPATGDTVIFGQKTLQQTKSALDRINVRRMMIYIKRHIGDIADTILFDQNVQATWLRFKSRAESVLAEVKSELGIVEYKLVLDETTTTPDLIDRNIMYAKVFVKPARSIEFIAVDFIITRSGVEF